MHQHILRNVMLGAFVLFSAQAAQDGPKPTCNHCPATYIPNEEIQAYLKRVPPDTGVSDQQMRALDVGKTNVDIGIVYRGKLSGGAPNVAEHDHVSEVYHIIDGSGTLVTGPDIVDWKPRPASNENVRLLNGPGGDGASITNGVKHYLKAGDVIVIPAGTGHQFTEINDHIRYLMIRLDPDKIVPLKNEQDSREDLQKKPGQ